MEKLTALLIAGLPAAVLTAGPAPAQPFVELQLFSISDTSGAPNSNAPGSVLPFFQPGETVRITLVATNTGDPAAIRTSLVLAGELDHGTPVYESQLEGEDNTSDSPLESGETDYYSFDWSLPTDTDWGRYDLLGSISSPDLVTVYDETTPGPSTTGFGADAWLPAFTVGSFGATVIIHGYQFFGNIPSWPNDVAEDIRDRIVRGRIWTYSPSLGKFVVTSPFAGNAENILVLDWANESNDNFEGHSEAVAEGLFTALLAGAHKQPPDWDIDHVHLLGHSRGAVVASETAQRLLAAGAGAVHATYLDPVWQGVNGSFDDFDVNANHPTLGTTGVAAWSEADHVDNFYSTDDNGELIQIDGSPIDGARNLDLSGRGSGVGHSDVWRWYDGTIDLDGASIDGGNIQAAWYGGAGLERDEDGFNQSRLGGSPRTPMSGTTTGISFSWVDDGIVNGDFGRGPQGSASDTRPDPGWDIHGGGGSGSIGSNQLVLEAGAGDRTHNRVFVPAGFAAIVYRYVTQTTAPGDPDTLVVSAIDQSDATVVIDEVVMDGSPVEATRMTSLAAFSGEVVALQFEVAPAGVSVASEVVVDDVAFSTTPVGVALDVRLFLEGPYSDFSMTTALNTDLPLTQPFTGSPWSYGGSESVVVMPADVVDWLLVEVRSDTSSASTVERQAVLLTASGDIRDVATPVAPSFAATPFGSYYVVANHRNHISVMTSSAVDLTGGTGSWDFTTGLSQAYGSRPPMKSLSGGSFVMFACDVSADGQITASDFNTWLADTKSAATGYQPADCNLDGQVTASDFNLWLANTKSAASSQVPD